MDISQLEHFLCVVDNKSVTKAAEEFHISQPALSNSIQRLEAELGQPLFDRVKKKMILTHFGQYYIPFAREILELVKLSKLPYEPGEKKPHLSIALQNYNATFMDMVIAFSAAHPDVRFNIQCSVLNSPFSGENYDFIVGNADEKPLFPCQALNLGVRSYFAVIPKHHRLAGSPVVDIQELRGEPMCLLRNEQGEFEHAYKLCIANGFIPNIMFATNSPSCKLYYMNSGRCTAIIPTNWHQQYQSLDNIEIIPIKGYENYTNVQLFWQTERPLTATAMLFLQFCRDRLEQPDKVFSLFNKN